MAADTTRCACFVFGLWISSLVGSLAACGGGTTASVTGATTIRPTSAPTKAAHTAADALAFVKTIYAPYVATGAKPTLGNCFSTRPCPGPITNYMTPELEANLERKAKQGTGIDPVICAQNTPARIAYDAPKVSAGTATIIVHTYYTGSGDNPIALTVDLGSLKLTRLRCATP